MISDYNSLPDDAKVWVFPSQKKLYANEIESIEKKISDFILEWENENEDLTATFTIKYNRFIVLFAETETTISTKTTNELISFIIQLQTDLETELMDKMNACFKQGQYVQYKDLKDFKKLIKDKGVNKKTIVFDNTIATKLEFDEYWEVPASESWYGNMFK
ncbi:ABC transporter ATPase [Flavicella sp.]|uniref:ABC transporter ATPase n=1 Tax=Flavicella sp. TaxID=2957742 RepID=UPI00262FC0FB|nr:ABC transporter ATPase [Flavicella sp.]MDG1805683.1 ABC transporter ATPase [Flavicella sp.]